MTSYPDFKNFFQALWHYEPFPWQNLLAKQVAEKPWPQAIDLPTASGKTACIDIAIHALARQAERPLSERIAPRRIWFVVDRRIVVDEAFDRAQVIADKLEDAKDGPLKEVADRLRVLSGKERPLATARLRGGVLRDDGWARLPSQPAVITSTVDQLGSRLLFRGFGHSRLAAPIFAGLAANDSLILLDEAHCSVPFLQTLRAIEGYRNPKWAERPISTPFAFVVMSATPPKDIPGEALFPGAQREQALHHPELDKRLKTSKRAELNPPIKTTSENDWLITEAVARAWEYVEKGGKRRVGVMVNRVRTAKEIAQQLRERAKDAADIVLLTGRMRPFERDRLVERWKPFVRATKPNPPGRPIVIVSTQCLEVGADFSFEALVSECASLDALRQRFGRLARLGASEPAPATVLVRETDVKEGSTDPVYGEALARTWKWLWDSAAPEANETRILDFGVEALDTRLSKLEDVSPYLAPAPNAPILLPAHLDLLCQTAPPPYPEPDTALYLHGRRAAPEVQVVWRCDLSPGRDHDWIETVALCPPSSMEMLSVPIWRLRAWLGQRETPDVSTDVEGEGAAEEPDADATSASFRPCVVWRRRDRSKIAREAADIAPGDVLVVPAEYGIDGLGQSAVAEALGEQALDLWEPARKSVARPTAVRLNRAAVAPWLSCQPLADLIVSAEAPTRDREEIIARIDAVLEYQPEGEESPLPPPEWWRDGLRAAKSGSIEEHPAGGIVLFAIETAALRRRAEPELFADDDDLTAASGREVSLDDHSASAKRAADKLASLCLPNEFRAAIGRAAYWHDVGKLDERFQMMLHQGDEIAAASAEGPLAKSAFIPTSPARRRAIREASGLPENFRHEMLSAHLAELYGVQSLHPDEADLVLHLIASHHGHGRPFAPVSDDPSPPAVQGRLGDVAMTLDAATRASRPPPHRVDSGVADRFWRLTRRYGWWGLAYLEATVRLGDWYGSVFIIDSNGGEGNG